VEAYQLYLFTEAKSYNFVCEGIFVEFTEYVK